MPIKLEHSLDKTDLRILRLLQKEGRLSNLELADKVGLSPSPCSRRVKLLEQNGYIDSYHARLNNKALNLNMTAMIHISMAQHTPEHFAEFEQQITQHPQVQECFLITGQSADFILKVVVADMDDYQDFLLGKLTKIPGVTGVHSSFVLRKIIDTTALPI